MKQQNASIIDNPRIRLPTIDAGRLKNNKTSIVGFLEVDITSLREQIRKLHKQNILFSFTSCIIKIIGDCVAANKAVQAVLLNDRKLFLFDDVDLSISIERVVDNTHFPYPLIIRAVNKKSIFEIDKEIKIESEKKIIKGEDLFVVKNKKSGKFLLQLFYMIPSKARVYIMDLVLRKPGRAKNVVGTVGFATVNMAGRLAGWAFPTKNPYSLYIALGSINKKPLVIKNEIKIRDVLNMTTIFDHNIIDGAPARNFMNILVNQIENRAIDIYKR